MHHPLSPSGPELPSDAWKRLEGILHRFEHAWKRGERPAIKDYLALIEQDRRALLIELVHEDLEQRLHLGEPVRVEAYLAEYPELASDAPAAADLLAAEFVLREKRGEAPRLEEYQNRFPEHAQILPQRVADQRDRALGRAESPPNGKMGSELPTLPPGVQPAEAVTRQPAARPGPEAVSGGMPSAADPATLPAGAPSTHPAPASPLAAAEWVAVAGYEVLCPLGKGGMGVVYKARQIGLDRLVGLKMILHGQHAGPEDLERFRAEAQAVARLQHPNIVQVYDVGECQGLPYFSMEFCPGGSLAEQLDGTPWEPRRAASLVETLARAVHAAHQAQVVHRDLKPANVLLGSDGTPKVTDFGLAKRLDVQGRTQTGAVVGTPSYMAPEQAGAKGAVVGPAADVYALGAILYELLTGRPPFKAATPLDTILQVVSEEPVGPRRLNARIPVDLETICLKCLSKAPAARYASAAELADDLKHWQAGEPIKARPVGAVGRWWRWTRRNPVLAAASLLALAGLVTAASLGFVVAGRAKASARADRQRLGQSLLAEARAEREAGNRWAALERVDEAAKIDPTAEVRQEAIQAITASGVRLVKEVSTRRELKENHEDVVKQRLGEFAPPNWWRYGGGWTTGMSLPRQAKGTQNVTGDPFKQFSGGPQILVAKLGDVVSKVFYWDPKKRDKPVDLPASAFSGVMRESSDGTWVAYRDVNEPDVVRLWDCRRARPHGRLEGRGEAALVHASAFPGAEFSPDNRLLATAHWRAGAFALQLDEVGSCLPVKSVPGVAPVLWLADGRHLLSHGRSVTGQKDDRGAWADDRESQGSRVELPFAQVWEVAAPVPTYRRNGAITRALFNNDHTQLLVDDTVWEVSQGERGVSLRQTELDVPGAVLGFRGKELWAATLPAKPPTNRGYAEASVPVLSRLAVGPLAATGPGGPLAGLNSFLAGTALPEWHPPRLIRLSPPGQPIWSEPPDYSEQLKMTWNRVWQEKRDEQKTIETMLAFPFMRATRATWRPETAFVLAQADAGSRDWYFFRNTQSWSIGTATGRSPCHCWDATTGRVVAVEAFRNISASRPGIDPASAFSRDGKHFVTPELVARTLTVRNGDDGSVVRSFKTEGPLQCDWFVWGVDGRFFVALSADREAGGFPVAGEEKPGLYSNPEAGMTKALIFDTQGDTVRALMGPKGEWTAVALSAGAETVFTGGDGGLLRVRDGNSGRELARWRAHAAGVTALTLSSDGKLLVSGGRDGTIRVWNIPWIRSELANLGLDW
jgi:hypothetical protein